MSPSNVGALDGVRVIESGELVSASYAAKLMADLGADVVKVESPAGGGARRRGPFPRGCEGDSEASGLFLYLNANKRGVSLDLDLPADRERLLTLLGGADVWLHNLPVAETRAQGLDYEQVAERCPQLVVTWVTPFGLSGPHAEWEADELSVVAASGWASISPGRSSFAELPPLKAFGRQADFQAAAHASLATMGALFARRATGRGQLVEVSAQECIAAALELALVTYTYTGVVPSRLGIRTAGPMEIMECKDGLIFVMTPQEHQWESFVQMMDDPEWAHLEVFADRLLRGENADALRPLVEEWLRDYTVQEVFDLAAEAHVPFAPVSTMGDLVNSPQLKARGYFATLDQPGVGPVTIPGAPYLMPDTPWELRRPAPRLGEHNAELLHSSREEAGRGR